MFDYSIFCSHITIIVFLFFFTPPFSRFDFVLAQYFSFNLSAAAEIRLPICLSRSLASGATRRARC